MLAPQRRSYRFELSSDADLRKNESAYVGFNNGIFTDGDYCPEIDQEVRRDCISAVHLQNIQQPTVHEQDRPMLLCSGADSRQRCYGDIFSFVECKEIYCTQLKLEKRLKICCFRFFDSEFRLF